MMAGSPAPGLGDRQRKSTGGSSWITFLFLAGCSTLKMPKIRQRERRGMELRQKQPFFCEDARGAVTPEGGQGRPEGLPSEKPPDGQTARTSGEIPASLQSGRFWHWL